MTSQFQNSAQDPVVLLACRSAIGRAKKGSLALTRPDDLIAQVLRAAVQKAAGLGIQGSDVDDVLIGCAMPEGEQGLNVARLATLAAGLPDTVSAATINRFCASGVETIATAAAKIIAGQVDVAFAGGVESMTMVPMSGNKPSMSAAIASEHPEAYTPMGITAENVVKKFGVSRERQDVFALASHRKATEAVERGRFSDEIVPVASVGYDGKGNRVDRTFDRDELIRPDSTLEALAALKPSFAEGGTVTAGNSSPLSDGAAVVLLASRRTADRLGATPLGTLRGYATAGVDPSIMGIGPVPAVRKLLAKTGVSLSQIDVVEMNEAFASQSVYCQGELGISDAQLNPNGGAIALGHPLGATGARMTATLLHQLRRQGGRFGIVTMCVGGGMGAAALYERA